jgi:hypothetical protein
VIPPEPTPLGLGRDDLFLYVAVSYSDSGECRWGDKGGGLTSAEEPIRITRGDDGRRHIAGIDVSVSLPDVGCWLAEVSSNPRSLYIGKSGQILDGSA